MSIITKLSKLFAKKGPSAKLGLALHANGLDYCMRAAGEAKVDGVALIAGSYGKTLAAMIDEQKLSGQCHLVLAQQHYYLVQVDKPEVPDAEVLSALKWQIKDLVPLPPENMVLDYFDGPESHGSVDKINVACAASSELSPLVRRLSNDDIQLTSIITPEFAFASLLPGSDDACLMLCQQPDEEMFILIVKQQRIFFYRHLRGFAQIGLKSTSELGYGIIDSLSLEIQKSSDYFERQLKQAPIAEIKLIVPIANEQFLADKLAENTNVPVTLLELPNGFNAERGKACAIGATMFDLAEVK